MTLLQNIVISGAQGLLMLMGSKFLIKITRPQNIAHLNVLWSDNLHQKFWSHQHQETLSTWNSNILQWGHDQNFNPIKHRRPWLPILISYLFQQGLLALGHSFFTPGMFWFRFHFFFKKTTICTSKNVKCCQLIYCS